MAEQDGIKVVETEKVGNRQTFGHTFLIDCNECSRQISTKVYRRDKIYLCEYCKNKIERKKEEIIFNYLDKIVTPKEQAFNRACEELKKQVNDYSSYENTIRIARSRCELYGSIPEAMVAIELIKLGYSIIPQQKVGKFIVDFVLPKNKIVIEIDGSIFHNDGIRIGREEAIKIMLGREYEIIHIPAEDIRKQIKVMKTIMDKAQGL